MGGSVKANESDGEYSEIKDKGEIGFLDFKDYNSLYDVDRLEEGPVVISFPFLFINHKPQSAFIGQTSTDSITIKNTTGDSVELWSVRIYSSNPVKSYLLSLAKPPSAASDEESVRRFVSSDYLEDRVLQPGQTLTVWISCTPKDIGLHTSVIHFDLGDDKIERVVFLLADDHISQALSTSKFFCRAHSLGIPSEVETDDLGDLLNSSFPFVFIGIHGCDEREDHGSFWFNRIEASKVVHIIQKLAIDGNLRDNDIGVITPYRQQVFKIRKALWLLNMPYVKVGSVEEFQGQKKRIIIISTVCSTAKHNEFDLTHNLGLIGNPQRFDVATTRTKSLHIIVGNPHILVKDPLWAELLRRCVDNGTYHGCLLPESHTRANKPSDYGDESNGPSHNSVETQWDEGTEWNQNVPAQYPNDVESKRNLSCPITMSTGIKVCSPLKMHLTMTDGVMNSSTTSTRRNAVMDGRKNLTTTLKWREVKKQGLSSIKMQPKEAGGMNTQGRMLWRRLEPCQNFEKDIKKERE